ncbi:hypothetical protein T492DRAFT_890314 [Pavlovales sp. CCMP2436]|nr:hypothetical protein T492DRAFT_890314 [Pavlovales sp. CCMP2436]
MAVSNSFGSQIINILIGLGMPWAISNAWGQPIRVGDIRHISLMGGLQACNVFAIFVALLGVAFTCGHNKAVLNRRKGGVLLATYIFAVGTYAAIVFTPDSSATLARRTALAAVPA